MSAPLLSIVIPVFNAEDVVGACLDSIVRQDFDSFETIVVDDGSSDESLSFCKSYFDDGRLKGAILTQANQGPLAARQAGYMAANGDYIIHVDCDDQLREDALSFIAKAIWETEADIILFNYTPKLPFNPSNRYVHNGIGPYWEETINRERLLRFFCSGRGIYLWEKAVRKELLFPLLEKRFHSLRYEEDNLQTCAIVNSAVSMAYIPQDLYYHVYSETGLDGVFDLSHFNDHCAVRSEVRQYVSVWNREFPDSNLNSFYCSSSISWLMHKALFRSNDRELLEAIADSEELKTICSEEGAVSSLSSVDRALLWFVSGKHWGMLKLADDFRRILKTVRLAILRS